MGSIVLAVIIVVAIPVLIIYMIITSIRDAIRHKIEVNDKEYILSKKAVLKECVSKDILGMAHRLVNEYSIYETNNDKLGFDKTIYCSNAIVGAAKYQPIKYLIKYTDIKRNTEQLNIVEYNYNYTIELIRLGMDLDTAIEQMFCTLGHRYYKYMNNQSLVAEILQLPEFMCNPRGLMPCVRFSYTSPAGRVNNHFDIRITPDVLEEVRRALIKIH